MGENVLQDTGGSPALSADERCCAEGRCCPLPRCGRFVTLEGIDGCGKTTQARLLVKALECAGYPVLALREPGGARISEQIRSVLLDPENRAMGPVCELLLYEAARAQLVHEIVKPALAAGRIVVCDRFYDSTTAYQGFAGGLGAKVTRRANELAVAGCRPDLTIVYDLSVSEAARRASAAMPGAATTPATAASPPPTATVASRTAARADRGVGATGASRRRRSPPSRSRSSPR